jgi:hypothetical protein
VLNLAAVGEIRSVNDMIYLISHVVEKEREKRKGGVSS